MTAATPGLLRPVVRPLVVSTVIAVIGGVIQIVPYVAIAELAGELLGDGAFDAGRVRRLGYVAVLAAGLSGLCAFVAGIISHLADNDLQLDIRRRIAGHLRRVPLGWFSATTSGEVKKVATDDVMTMHHLVAHSVLEFAAAATAPVIAIVYLALVDWQLTLVVCIPLVAGVALYGVMMSKSGEMYRDYDVAMGRLNAAAVEFVQGIAVVKTFGEPGRAHRRFLAEARAYIERFWSMVRSVIHVSAASEVVLSPAFVLVFTLAAGTLFVDRGWITAVDAVPFALLALGITAPIAALAASGEQLRQAVLAKRRIDAVLTTPALTVRPAGDTASATDSRSATGVGVDRGPVDSPVDRVGADAAPGGGARHGRRAGPVAGVPQPGPVDGIGADVSSGGEILADRRSGSLAGVPQRAPADGSVVFEGVWFSYSADDAPAVSDIDLRIPAGTVTALVGASGSGKTTLARLAARFWDPDIGRVLIGGVDVATLEPHVLYRHVGMVFQDVQLLRAPVAVNVALGRPDASHDDIVRAAVAARIHDRIMQLPRGYDSVVGVDVTLSGGEAQRLSIARALLADTPVLVLDEATAFADPESEAEIQAAISTLVGGRTLLVIAHRLHTITGVDQIAVLDRGRVVEVGRHDQLLATDGAYSRLWQLYHRAATGPRPTAHDSGEATDGVAMEVSR